MAQTAQQIQNAIGPLFYDALSTRDNLICLVYVYAHAAGLTRTQCINGAAANSYAALSDHDLKQCILEVL